MITHPTVLKIDAEAQHFAALHRPTATPASETPAQPRWPRLVTPGALFACLRSLAQRAIHAPRRAAPQRQP
ncbi:MAG TPA: hypothetical protein VH916_13505 [Dehalococcoidia bacterium]|jgi:hypothetical protein